MSKKNNTDRAIQDELDRRIIKETQAGLLLSPEPYEEIAERLNVSKEDVISRINRMLHDGVIRRIGVVPNHYTLGFRGNGMSVWDVTDNKVQRLGCRVGALDFVSHAYLRPRHLPEWPYNLFAMVHGKDRSEVLNKVLIISNILGDDSRGHEVLFSTRILKKTGLRIQ